MKELKKLLKEAGVEKRHHKSIKYYLKVLKNRHEETFHHVMRVGRLAFEMAKHADIPNVTPEIMMWAGLLHDVGKALIDPVLLNKKAQFGDAERLAMEPHVIYGYLLLREIHDYTAHVIVRHHRYGRKPYPEVLPPLPEPLKLKQKAIDAAARLLALADFYDALTTRKNDRNVENESPRSIYLKENADCKHVILRLEEAGVLVF